MKVPLAAPALLAALGVAATATFAAGGSESKKAQAPEAKGPARPSGGLAAAGRKNLVPNGDFEKPGKGGPAGWARPDGLSTFWESASGRGKCIRIDTDVLSSEFRAREDEMEKARSAGRDPPPARKKSPTKGPKYDTVAGLDGVHFTSEPIAIDPSKRYILEVLARVEGSASPKAWVKAYGYRSSPLMGEEGSRKSRDVDRERIVWKKALVCGEAGREWKTFRMVFPRDTALPAGATSIRIQLYPYWPPATYWFDDVRLADISDEEARRFAEEEGLLDREKGGRKDG
jgi:hypothetical protein